MNSADNSQSLTSVGTPCLDHGSYVTLDDREQILGKLNCKELKFGKVGK